MVLKTLARNKPGALSEAKIAETKDMIYMEAIKITPMMAAIRLTLFIQKSFLENQCNTYLVTLYRVIS